MELFSPQNRQKELDGWPDKNNADFAKSVIRKIMSRKIRAFFTTAYYVTQVQKLIPIDSTLTESVYVNATEDIHAEIRGLADVIITSLEQQTRKSKGQAPQTGEAMSPTASATSSPLSASGATPQNPSQSAIASGGSTINQAGRDIVINSRGFGRDRQGNFKAEIDFGTRGVGC